MKKFLTVFLGLVTLLLVVQAAVSLKWRIEHDSPLLLYMASLMERFGYVPYRDFFDVNMLGAYWANLLVGKLAGWSDPGYRTVDLGILAAISTCTFLWMRSFNRLAAWASAAIFGCLYLSWGPATALQREYLLLLPLSLGLAAYSVAERRPGLRRLLIGFALGGAALIKPQAALGLAAFLAFEIGEERKAGEDGYAQDPVTAPVLDDEGNEPETGLAKAWRKVSRPTPPRLRPLLPLLVGFFAPLAAAFIYLWQANALRPFLDIAVNYWPLFNQLNGNQVALSGGERLRYLIDRLLTLRDYPIWLAPALLGLFNSQFLAGLGEAQRRKARLIFWLAVCYALYTLAGGTFWAYHWMPFGYFVIQLASLTLLELPKRLPKGARLFAAGTLAFATLVALDLPHLDQRLQPQVSDRLERVDRMAAFLERNLEPGARVQALDWTGGGVVQAMLISGARPATRFSNDFHFYHHLSSPYIQALRKELIGALKDEPPRYIIRYVGGDKPWLSGEDTTGEFAALELFLERNYRVVVEEEGLRIYELKK